MLLIIKHNHKQSDAPFVDQVLEVHGNEIRARTLFEESRRSEREKYDCQFPLAPKPIRTYIRCPCQPECARSLEGIMLPVSVNMKRVRAWWEGVWARTKPPAHITEMSLENHNTTRVSRKSRRKRALALVHKMIDRIALLLLLILNACSMYY